MCLLCSHNTENQLLAISNNILGDFCLKITLKSGKIPLQKGEEVAV